MIVMLNLQKIIILNYNIILMRVQSLKLSKSSLVLPDDYNEKDFNKN